MAQYGWVLFRWVEYMEMFANDQQVNSSFNDEVIGFLTLTPVKLISSFLLGIFGQTEKEKVRASPL